jgi:hypothetical protein
LVAVGPPYGHPPVATSPPMGSGRSWSRCCPRPGDMGGRIMITAGSSTASCSSSTPASPGATCRSATVPGRPSTAGCGAGPRAGAGSGSVSCRRAWPRRTGSRGPCAGALPCGVGTKVHLVTDGRALPLAPHLTDGQHQEFEVPAPVLEAVRIRLPRGRPRQRPEALAGDKAYTFPRLRHWLRAARAGGHSRAARSAGPAAPSARPTPRLRSSRLSRRAIRSWRSSISPCCTSA